MIFFMTVQLILVGALWELIGFAGSSLEESLFFGTLVCLLFTSGCCCLVETVPAVRQKSS